MTSTAETHSVPDQTNEQIQAVYQHLIQANPQLASAASRIMAHPPAA